METETSNQPPSLLLTTFNLSSSSANPVSIYRGDESEHERVTPTSKDDSKPYVTLTFAQSLDAKIAGQNGKQLILSGKESMVMTHWMRTMHDGILIGIGTALNDNPQLNTRHLPALPSTFPHRYHLPRPIILDTHLRFSVDSKLVSNYRAGIGRRPWIISSRPSSENELSEWNSKQQRLQAAGVTVVDVESKGGQIQIPALLQKLRSLGIRSLMVEGGAQIIKSFLTHAGLETGSKCVDAILVTTAPVFVGNDGVGYGQDLIVSQIPSTEHVLTEVFGRDVMMSLRVV
ncbi:dihydrofolate reductase-like domain-containing protein [Abortiporus biennis]|nr:dihydrofolate reductase-like domain-containing protein [Abortiporus biennis]